MSELLEIVATERQEHLAFMTWIRLNPTIREVLIHIANEYDGGAARGQIRKTMGVMKGVSDFFLPIPKGLYHGMWIELKRKKNGRCTDEQKRWIEQMKLLGYAAYFCFGDDEAINTVKKYMEIKKNAKI